MRKRFVESLSCALFALFVSTTSVAARQHQHSAPASGEQKPAQVEKKKDPNRKKPENQPGKVMNAEELAASHAGHHAMEVFPDGGVLLPGWKHRFDLATMKLEHVMFHAAADSFHIKTGPPGIFYHPEMNAAGAYQLRATFRQLSKGEHREGYGPFIGGADLDGAGQRYTYFLVRQDGKFLIKQRIGVNTKGVVDWTAHPAINMFRGDGSMRNELAILVEEEIVRFLINGTEVSRHPRTELPTAGVYGLRVNHQLNIEIEGFTVTPAGTSRGW